jgi:hypothetical protein
MMPRWLAPLLLILLAPGLRAAEIPEAEVVLDVIAPSPPGQIPSAAPPRFVLLKDRQVFVGGTARLFSGRLEKDEVKEIEKRLSKVRKLPGIGSMVVLSPGGARYRLLVREGRPLEILATGDPVSAPPALRPLATLLHDLAAFDHPSLRPWEPTAFALSAREATLGGGCRTWTLPVSIPEAVSAPRALPAAVAADWPTGAIAASVCAGDKTYAVTLRPLLPGEKP